MPILPWKYVIWIADIFRGMNQPIFCEIKQSQINQYQFNLQIGFIHCSTHIAQFVRMNSNYARNSSKIGRGKVAWFCIDCCGVLCFVILTTTAAVPFPFETFVKKVSKIFQIQFYRWISASSFGIKQLNTMKVKHKSFEFRYSNF